MLKKNYDDDFDLNIIIKNDVDNKPTRARLSKINPTELNWRVHGMGLAQAYLSKETRVHVWHHNLMDTTRTDQFTHSHRWELKRSQVLIGHITHIEYRDDDEDDELDYEEGKWTIWAHGNSDTESLIPIRMIERCHRIPIGVAEIQAGEEYHFSPYIYHETWADDFTITLIERGQPIDRSWAIIPYGIIPVNGLEMDVHIPHMPIIEEAWKRL